MTTMPGEMSHIKYNVYASYESKVGERDKLVGYGLQAYMRNGWETVNSKDGSWKYNGLEDIANRIVEHCQRKDIFLLTKARNPNQVRDSTLYVMGRVDDSQLEGSEITGLIKFFDKTSVYEKALPLKDYRNLQRRIFAKLALERMTFEEISLRLASSHQG